MISESANAFLEETRLKFIKKRMEDYDSLPIELRDFLKEHDFLSSEVYHIYSINSQDKNNINNTLKFLKSLTEE